MHCPDGPQRFNPKLSYVAKVHVKSVGQGEGMMGNAEVLNILHSLLFISCHL